MGLTEGEPDCLPSIQRRTVLVARVPACVAEGPSRRREVAVAQCCDRAGHVRRDRVPDRIGRTAQPCRAVPLLLRGGDHAECAHAQRYPAPVVHLADQPQRLPLEVGGSGRVAIVQPDEAESPQGVRPRPWVSTLVQVETPLERLRGCLATTVEQGRDTDVGPAEGLPAVVGVAVARGRCAQQPVGRAEIAAEESGLTQVLPRDGADEGLVVRVREIAGLLQQRPGRSGIGGGQREVAGGGQPSGPDVRGLRAGCQQPVQPPSALSQVPPCLPVEPQVGGDGQPGGLLTRRVQAERQGGAQLRMVALSSAWLTSSRSKAAT